MFFFCSKYFNGKVKGLTMIGLQALQHHMFCTSLTLFTTPPFSSCTSQMASLMFPKCTGHTPSTKPLHLFLFLPENSFLYSFAQLAALLPSSLRLNITFPMKLFPDGYDTATLTSYQVFFSILSTLYNMQYI